MAHIKPFAAVRFSKKKGFDYSNLIAPPYDVLDEKSKATLQSRDAHNIVEIDLPHLPAKTVGPDAAYVRAATTYQQWLREGILERDKRAAIYPYMQSYQHNGRTYHRRGLFALVRLSPFGKGEVVPHEKTYEDAIIDRFKLTSATGVQLSPIFGLFSDPRHEVTNLLYSHLGKSEISATLDGVQNDMWSVTESEIETKVIDLFARKPIYIADGHHRYTMALAYQKAMTEKNGGPLPPNHPANYCLFVLVGMQDDGLIVLPTHRLIGGLKDFSPSRFAAHVSEHFDVKETTFKADQVANYIDEILPKLPPHTFGLFDAATHKLYQLMAKNPDVLAKLEPGQSESWRKLDVAIVQRYLLDEVIAPKFGVGGKITKGYTAISSEVFPKTDGKTYQMALLLKSTPLHALEELGKHNEVMPQKSTYFYPKLATGMVINPVTP